MKAPLCKQEQRATPAGRSVFVCLVGRISTAVLISVHQGRVYLLTENKAYKVFPAVTLPLVLSEYETCAFTLGEDRGCV